ncbi:remorin family protein [Tanacetum coccineum]|uniref:Remorin family protein n=1 Tax=Tanacetum coccineum TaxID=301880 RepID=A0ABQ4Z659_9ASTR
MTDFVPRRAVIDAAQRKREEDAVTLLKRIRKFSVAQDSGARAAIYIFSRINFAIARGGIVGRGLSPVKLRGMLKKKKKQDGEEDDVESTNFCLGSQDSEMNDSGECIENYKDVDVVSVLPERQTLATSDKEYDSVIDKVSSLPFEFQKTERAPHRKPTAPFSKQAPSKWDDAQKWIASPTSSRVKTEQPVKKNSYGNRQPITKVVVEVPDQRLVPYEEPDTKQIDSSHLKDEKRQYVNWESEYGSSTMVDSHSKSILMIGDSCNSEISLSRHDSSPSIQNTTFVPPPSEARSVSMRDMGTEMTPIASQEPSRTGTPVRATTPSRSPSTSRSATPERTGPVSSSTRQMESALGNQLGKKNIASWASKEDEDKDVPSSGKDERTGKSASEMHATAWEHAEKAKYMARFKREEIKIEAWENHQKAKTEAEMRRIEVEVERMRGGAHDRLMNKLAAARLKAEEKRAAAEAKRNREAARAEEQAAYIRKTGRVPSSFSCYCWCF